ncbi:Uncharacterised protein [Chlamydia trachomatis]|nr:Uncharacterised protein [Chlamydia trachomatis]
MYRSEVLLALLIVGRHLVLCQTIDAHVVIKSRHRIDFLLSVKVLELRPTFQFGTLLGVSPIESVDEHVGFLVADDVTSDGLAKDFRVTIHIQKVVLQLECQAYFLAEAIQVICIFGGSIAQDGTNLQRTSQQNTCFETNHLDVFVLCHIIPLLKIHIILLSFTYLQGRLCKHVDDLFQLVGPALRHALVGQHQH